MTKLGWQVATGSQGQGSRPIVICMLLIVLLAGVPASTLFAVESSQSLILKNVMLLDEAAEDKARRVNIRIKDGLLDLVTEDPIPADDGARVYDAKDGYVVGALDHEQPATLLIVTGDPRDQPYLLLDTRRHASFAISDGSVLRNRLLTVDEKILREEQNSQGWLAYTPPPTALPTTTEGSRWNQFDGQHLSGVFFGAVALDRINWLDQDENSRSQVGNLKDFAGGEVRAFRFGVVGRIKFDRPWVWFVSFASNAFDKGIDVKDIDDFRVYDARLDIPLASDLTLSVGKQKEPISMERLMPLSYLPMQERPAFLDALLRARKIGVALSTPLLNERMTLAGGVFNSWLDKGNGGIDENPTSFTGRATWMPFESENRTTTLHLGTSYRYSNARGGAAVAETPEFYEAPPFVETGLLEGDSLEQLGGELSYRTGPFFIHSEYLTTNYRGTNFGDLNFKGYQLTGAWTATGEVRPYNHRTGTFGRLPVSMGLGSGGWGSLEVAARFSHLDLSDEDLDGGVMDIWSLGFNWWLTPVASLGVNYRFIELDRFGVKGTSHGINTRLFLQLE